MTFSLNVKQAVAASGLTRSHLYEAMKAGKLTVRKAGRRTIILAEDLRQYIESLPTAQRKEA
ncbi:helix-turn-helix transcriptional regulator [Aerobium aerolatum]|uniref:Helix-turn-helix domain-containing protein n=1 Tax=Aquamicrobium aerolatum DSM 21857 TaxID=1121003 RepID=A0A1I3Q553_9HYPH|nr:helix-turn-helix domain-containing protein [Aquamicrobium aerolatum]SFJ28266.1 Helix-turn-helix domain-containing protein [Aquamicrobium aerolatum DSM 21857]